MHRVLKIQCNSKMRQYLPIIKPTIRHPSQKLNLSCTEMPKMLISLNKLSKCASESKTDKNQKTITTMRRKAKLMEDLRTKVRKKLMVEIS